MTTRSLIIKSNNTGRTYLIDNGCGTKFDEKFTNIYGIDYSTHSLASSLEHFGISPEEITDLIFTHLHFDHCGGTTYYKDDQLNHTFPNATYWVTNSQLNTANDPNVREKASFLKDNVQPITRSDRLQAVQGPHTYEEGLETVVVNGHTIGQQLPLISGNGTTILFAADLIPTSAHVSLPWVMAFDMRPIDTLDEKNELLTKAVEHNWYLYLEHDPETEVITIGKEKNRFKVSNKLSLNDI